MNFPEKQYICSYDSSLNSSHLQFFILSDITSHSELYKFLVNRSRIECYTNYSTCQKVLQRGEEILRKIVLDLDSDLVEKYLLSETNIEMLYNIMQDSDVKDKIIFRKKGKKPIDFLKEKNEIIMRRRLFYYEDMELAYR